MSTKAVVFDLDGTLLDTLKDIAISTNYVLEKYGKKPIEIKKYKYLVGSGALKLMRDILPGEDEKSINRALKLFEEHYLVQYSKNTKLYEDIDKLLDFLQEEGYKLSILSNKVDSFTKHCAQKYLNKWKFEVVYGIRENVPRKPDPAGVFDIFKTLHVKADECWYFGDTNIDMITAKNAGIKNSIGVLWGFRDKAELEENGARYTVATPIDAINIISGTEGNK